MASFHPSDVLLLVRPQLLSSALRRSLADRGRGVTVPGGGSEDPGTVRDAHYAVAIVTDPLPEGVSADTVISLAGRRGAGGVVVDGRRWPFDVDHPAHIAQLVDVVEAAR